MVTFYAGQRRVTPVPSADEEPAGLSRPREAGHRFQHIAVTTGDMLEWADARLTRYQAALDVGADPAIVTQWINDVQRETARKKLDALPSASHKHKPPLNALQIREMAESLGVVAQRIHAATDHEKARSTKPWASPSATNTKRGPRS